MSKDTTVTISELTVSKPDPQYKAGALTVAAKIPITAETPVPAILTVVADAPITAPVPGAADLPVIVEVPVTAELPAVTEATVPEAPFYILPDTLRNWPYERIISPYYRAAQAESVGWIESFHPFSPAAQKAFNRCDFSK